MAAAKAKGKSGKAKVCSKRDAYKVEGNKLVRTRPVCPKCGPGVFMATHSDRVSCGNCGYTQFNKQ